MVYMNSLFAKVFLLIVSIVVVIILLFSYSTIKNQKNALLDVLFSKSKTISKSVLLVILESIVTDDDSFVVEHVQKVIENNVEMKYIVIKKNNGSSLYNETSNWSVLENLPQNINDLESDKIESKILISSLSSEKVYHFCYPIKYSGITWGWISIGVSLENYYRNMESLYKDSLFLVLVMIFASIVFSYIIAKWLVGPISILNIAAKKISNGDLSVKVDISQKGEIGELAVSFNHMVDSLMISDMKLRKTNDALEQRVMQRTQELNILNQELDHKVKEEVLKRVKQEQILIQQSRLAAMGEMIGNIAHQWRQPLNALSLLVQNIEYAYEKDNLNDEYMQHAVKKSNKLTESMSQTINDFRNFFNPNRNFELFSYEQVYKSTMEMIGSSIENNMITINEDIQESVCVNGFKSEFSQVILNILNNAKDALVENVNENRLINISIYKKDEFAYFCIEDNAGGINEKIIQKIFDPYYTTKDEGKGTGIGLYMSKMIIENNMNGSLKVENSTHGARFTIKIDLNTCTGMNNE